MKTVEMVVLCFIVVLEFISLLFLNLFDYMQCYGSK